MAQKPNLRVVGNAPQNGPLDKLRFIEALAAENKLTLNELRCAIMLLELHNDAKQCAWPSYLKIGQILGVSEKSATTIIAKLIRCGYFDVDLSGGGKGRSNRYSPRWDTLKRTSGFMPIVKRLNTEPGFRVSPRQTLKHASANTEIPRPQTLKHASGEPIERTQLKNLSASRRAAQQQPRQERGVSSRARARKRTPNGVDPPPARDKSSSRDDGFALGSPSARDQINNALAEIVRALRQQFYDQNDAPASDQQVSGFRTLASKYHQSAGDRALLTTANKIRDDQIADPRAYLASAIKNRPRN